MANRRRSTRRRRRAPIRRPVRSRRPRALRLSLPPVRAPAAPVPGAAHGSGVGAAAIVAVPASRPGDQSWVRRWTGAGRGGRGPDGWLGPADAAQSNTYNPAGLRRRWLGVPSAGYGEGATIYSEERRVADLRRARVSLVIAAITLLASLALGPAPLAGQVVSGFGPITVLDSTAFTAPNNPALQHNVPRLSVTVGAETLTADFLEFFNRTGGLQRWGYPTSEVHIEESGTLTQYYQRGVVDFHRRVDLGGIYVLERRLTWDYFGGGRDGSLDLGVELGTVNSNSGEFHGPWNHKVSNYSVGGVRIGFLDFFKALGGVEAFGFPKTQARIDTNATGTLHIAAATPGFIRQYFQAAVMEYHPQDSQAPVKLRLLGDDLRNQRYPADAWQAFSAFRAVAPLTTGQGFVPEIVQRTPAAPAPSPTPTAPADGLQATGELIVVGTTDRGILLFDGATWRSLGADGSVLGANRVQAVHVDKDGLIWAGTDRGLFRMNRTGQGAEFTHENTRGQLGSDNIRALAGRRVSDVLWIAHPGQGATWFDGASWNRLRSDNSQMPSSDVRGLHVAPGSEGGLMFATAGGAALYSRADQAWYIYNTKNSGIISGNVTAVEMDTSGALWFGTSDAGVSRTRNPLTWDHFGVGDGLGGNNVRDILVASDGTVWVATGGGVSSFRNGAFSTATSANSGLPSNNVRGLAEDSKGRIWVATDSGLGRYDGSTWTAFTTAQGMPAGAVSSIAVGVVTGS